DHGADTIWARMLAKTPQNVAQGYWNGGQCSGGFPNQTGCKATREMNDSQAVVELCCTFAVIPVYANENVKVQVTVVNQAHEPEPQFDSLLTTSYHDPNCFVGAKASINDSGDTSAKPDSNCGTLGEVWNTITDAFGFKKCDGIVLNKLLRFTSQQLIGLGGTSTKPVSIFDADVLGPPATKMPCGQQPKYGVFISEFEVPNAKWRPRYDFVQPAPSHTQNPGRAQEGECHSKYCGR
ncbi:MAG: hypothetical protein WB615_09175, partial [Candidatus Tumulicola sp.]